MSGLLESLRSMYAHDATVLAGIENGSVRGIPLTKGEIAIVDADDYEWLNQWKWCVHGKRIRYAHRGAWTGKKVVSIQMHRIVLNLHPGDGTIVDHINRDGRDNRKSNLRIVPQSINAFNCKLSDRNSTGYRGVTWHKRDKIWWAQIRVDTIIHYLGSYSNAISAAIAFDKAAVGYRGKNAVLNFPEKRSEYERIIKSI